MPSAQAAPTASGAASLHPGVGVAQNRIQRIKEQGHKCGDHSDAEQRDHEGEQGNAGKRLQQTDSPDHRFGHSPGSAPAPAPAAGPARWPPASEIPTSNRCRSVSRSMSAARSRDSRSPHSDERSVRRPRPAGTAAGRGPARAARRRHPRDGNAVHLDPPVEPAHVGLGEQPAQLGERSHRGRELGEARRPPARPPRTAGRSRGRPASMTRSYRAMKPSVE